MEDEYFYGTEKEIVSSMTEWLVENIEAVTSEEEKKKMENSTLFMGVNIYRPGRR